MTILTDLCFKQAKILMTFYKDILENYISHFIKRLT